ncbi:hypothetical protein ACS0TY_034597 [Phlomoides rotata]
MATVIGSSEQAILVKVNHDLLDCTFGFIHAASDYITRRDLWNFISDFHCSNLCLVRDFNAVLGAHKRISSRAPNSVSCADFQNFIEQEVLFEIEAAGTNYTWASRRSGQGFIASKLDIILAHDSFIVHLDRVSAAVLARAGSDHHPMVLHCAKDSSSRPRPFKFQSAWTIDSRFRELVRLSWNHNSRPPDPISRIMQKLKRLKGALRIWNRQVFGLINKKIADANQAILAVQAQIYTTRDSDQLLESEIEATIQLNRFLKQEQLFFAQKNRVSWLKDGDRNSAFFQRLHRIKKARPGINSLYIDGTLSTDQGAICENIVAYYSSLFRGLSTDLNMERVHEVIEPLVFNPEKSKDYFGKHVSVQNKNYFRDTLHIGSSSLPFTYLGVSLFQGAPKATHLRSTADRIIAKFTGWKGSALSMAGRVCLANLVIVSSLVHSMMVYKWPRSLLQKIDMAMRNFIWTGSTGRKSICPVSWTNVCASREEGGLGIRSIRTAIEAFLQRLAWNIINSKEASMLFVRARFFKGKSPISQYLTSLVWHGVREHSIHILKEARWILGKHSSVNFWLDNWLGYTIADRLGIPCFVREFLNYSVADYFFDDSWHL